jgi:hypothetical protein
MMVHGTKEIIHQTLGVGCVVDVVTGFTINFEIISKYCHICSINIKEMGTNYLNWQQ